MQKQRKSAGGPNESKQSSTRWNQSVRKTVHATEKKVLIYGTCLQHGAQMSTKPWTILCLGSVINIYCNLGQCACLPYFTEYVQFTFSVSPKSFGSGGCNLATARPKRDLRASGPPHIVVSGNDLWHIFIYYIPSYARRRPVTYSTRPPS